MEVTIDVLRQGDDEPRITTAFDEPRRSEIAEPIVVENGIDVDGDVRLVSFSDQLLQLLARSIQRGFAGAT